MIPQALLLFSIIAVALVLFYWESISPEVTALGVLLALAVTGLVPARQAFTGFGSDAVIMILGLLILTAALERTGVVEIAGRMVLRHTGHDPDHLFWAVIVGSAGIGAFISNTASTAFFLPMVFGVAKKSGVSASRLLMPMAFASILTSSVTLVSTSTNLVVSGMLTSYNLTPIGMFELAPVGIPIAVVGLIYVYLTRKFIPERAGTSALTEEFSVQPFLSEIVILPLSPLADKPLSKARFGEERGLTVLRIIRGNRDVVPYPDTILRSGDILVVEGINEDIVKMKEVAGIEIRADVRPSDPDLSTKELGLVEAVVLPGSKLIGQTLEDYRFHERYELQVLGINHQGVNVAGKIREMRIGLGDVLLVQGRHKDIAEARADNVFRVLGAMELLEEALPRRKRAGLASAIFVGVLALASFDVLTVPLSMMLGVLLVFVTRCITPQEAYAAVDWRIIILIASMLALGVAMEHTGIAKSLAAQIVAAVGTAGPHCLLTIFFGLTLLLTQPMSNQAAAIVVLPVAVQTALHAGYNPRTFAMMVAVAASCSYLTPLEPSCMMVYGPGRYRFSDFLKFGALLTFLIYGVAILLVPLIWPLR